jgi:hypothetical protein
MVWMSFSLGWGRVPHLAIFAKARCPVLFIDWVGYLQLKF